MAENETRSAKPEKNIPTVKDLPTKPVTQLTLQQPDTPKPLGGWMPVATEAVDWLAIALLLIIFQKPIRLLIGTMESRLGKGSGVSLFGGMLELPELPPNRVQLPPDQAEEVADELPQGKDRQWISERDKTYRENKRYYLYHTLQRSKKVGHKYRVNICVSRHSRIGSGDSPNENVVKAEFFFGKFWKNQIFEGQFVDGVHSVSIDAYGPFLALCKLTLENEEEVILERYIDFDGVEKSKTK